ncbi:MAG: uracil-DNA glycosylase, partial [Betaproteobacteria bacterium]|nr:uracil-DNA glycosylase [Betaproteobacteria bacterium]
GVANPAAPEAVPVADPLASPLAAPIAASMLPEGLAKMDWQSLSQAAHACQACGLCKGRNHSLFASGSATPGQRAGWLIVGDAPTDAENLAGQAFVGDEGVLLDAMLQSLGLSRHAHHSGAEQTMVTNAVKCHPPDNRNPSAQEIALCHAYLQRQIELLQPRVILALGRFAAQALLTPSQGVGAAQPLGKLRGQVHQAHGRPVVVSYHPSYLLRTPSDKAKAWADLCLAMQQGRQA